MLYNTGTIAVNGNTATGTGTNWTAPASQVRAGQTIIVMSNPVQMFQISSVNSATSMTVTPAASPALSGQKYGILVSDNISVEGLAQAMSQLIKEYDENIGAWETFATTSANQTITVTINGASVNIPGIGALARKGANSDITELKGLTTALSIAQGGTGATTAEGSRINLGLGSSATKDVGTASGNVMEVGAGGLLSRTPPLVESKWNMYPSGIMRSGGGSDNNVSYGSGLYCSYDTTICFHLHMEGGGLLRYRYLNGSSVRYDHVVYSTANTTKASDGTLKAASPVARIVKSQEACQRADVAEDGFSWCGCGTANSEAEGIAISRLDVGVYVLTGSAGLASEGWQILPPMDPGCMGELGVVEAEQTDNGELTIRLFKRKYMLGDEGEIVKTKGEPIDVPANSWIDVRLDMPENSLWNQRQKEAMEKETQEPTS
ncbi:phage tail protein [Enterobacter hormaechei]|uniref:phage tail fiber protein n=1 Tax=Enterobacter hormaechei TaxID=158836 RepID=UPI001362D16C|nr:phage tail protein [Enterobacter hormaechei]QHI58109.1 phage tail protein [Enterobacter hormaechei]